VLYLFGDSTESNLDFNFLAFLPEVIDAAVVLAECEVLLAATVERRHTRQAEAERLIADVEEFGKRAAQFVGPIAKDQAGTPVGRCAASIAMAVRGAVEREASQVRGALATERDELDQEDQRLQGRAKDALEKLLRTHDLPNPDKELEVAWIGAGVKATMRQRTNFGVEAVLALDIPPGSVLGPDLRVDRIAEGVEVNMVEAGGWLKKADKLVAHKLGRYHVVGVTVGPHVTVQLRVSPEPGATGFAITAYGNGELTIEPTGGGPARELAIDERIRPGLRLLAERLEAAARSLGESRGGLVSFELDGKPIAEHGHPRVLAERLMIAIAPTVQKIARHSRSPGELVLRRLLGDNRREEIFVSTAELLRRFEGLPAAARTVFEPLQLGEEPSPSEYSQPVPRAVLPSASYPVPQAIPPSASQPVPQPVPPATSQPFPSPVPQVASQAAPQPASSSPVEARTAPTTAPPPLPSSAEPRGIPRRTAPPPLTYDRSRPVVPLPDPRRTARPSAPPPVPAFEPQEPDQEEEERTVVLLSSSAAAADMMRVADDDAPDAPPRIAAVILDESWGSGDEPPAGKPPDDAAVGNPIDVPIDDADGLPSAK
jgi:hypothetical protein